MKNFIDRLRAWAGDDRGQDLIEYALLFSLIAIALVGGLSDARVVVIDTWNEIAADIGQAVP
jgi:Flp pilus assembly pilin Flp